MPAFLKDYGTTEGPLGFPMREDAARALDQILKGLPKTDDYAYRKAVAANAVTELNDQGFHFKISPPELHVREQGAATDQDTEALVMRFETPCADVYMNVALHHNRRRKEDLVPATVA